MARGRAARRRRAAARRAPLPADGPFHVGVLLENTPEYLLLDLRGAALAGATVVGINPTRRGAELAHDIRHTDCQLIVTDDRRAAPRSTASTSAPAPELVRRRSTVARVRALARHAARRRAGRPTDVARARRPVPAVHLRAPPAPRRRCV